MVTVVVVEGEEEEEMGLATGTGTLVVGSTTDVDRFVVITEEEGEVAVAEVATLISGTETEVAEWVDRTGTINDRIRTRTTGSSRRRVNRA